MDRKLLFQLAFILGFVPQLMIAMIAAFVGLMILTMPPDTFLSWTLEKQVESTQVAWACAGAGIAVSAVVPVTRLAPRMRKGVPPVVQWLDWIWTFGALAAISGFVLLRIPEIAAPDFAMWRYAGVAIMATVVPVAYGIAGELLDLRKGEVQAEAGTAPA
jgi:hypothetical protein